MTDIRKKLAGKTTKLAQERPKQDDHPAADMNDCREGSYYQLDINLILPNPELPDKQYDPAGLAELADSIRQNRLYQPIVVRKNEAGQIILVVGNRRLIAAKMAGLEKIPAIFTQGNPLEISLIENLQRENLKPLEEAEVLIRMLEEHGYSEEKLASAIGKRQPAISELIKLNRLPEIIKTECRQDDKYSRQLLTLIASLETPEAMMSLFNRAKQGNLMKAASDAPMTENEPQVTEPVPPVIAGKDTLALPHRLSEGDIEKSEQRRKEQLLSELQKLVNIIDELIV